MPHRVAWPPCPCPLHRSCNPQCHMPRRHRHNECAAVSISTLRHLCWSNGAVSCAGGRAWELERGVEVGDIAFCSGCAGCPRLSVCLRSRGLFFLAVGVSLASLGVGVVPVLFPVCRWSYCCSSHSHSHSSPSCHCCFFL